MPSSLPDGEPAPSDGALPASAVRRLGERGFGVYVHVPFCATRCGYCDFNTYTAAELGGTSQRSYVDAAAAEVRLASHVLGRHVRVDTVFFGGGTPTLLGPDVLGNLLNTIRDEFELVPDAEVTAEANPESVDLDDLRALRAAGYTRVSLGMQSARPHVLAALDRRHTPGRAVEMVAAARDAGFEHVSVDLIYGAPGETDDDWKASVDAVTASGVDHVSAYSLIVEPGTRLAAQVARGEVQVADDDAMADRYDLADRMLEHAGLQWYEVSNWARDDDAQCRHNVSYWRSADWWGIGPGAHSHIGGTRWWNVKHPAAYAERLHNGLSPAAAREVLTDEQRRVEDVMLRVRMREGLPIALLDGNGRAAARQARADGLLDSAAYDEGRAVLTQRGRLLADAVVRALTG